MTTCARAAIIVLALGGSLIPNTERADPARGPVFQQGLADRERWENWFGSLTGDYKLGAEFWAGQRSLPNPGTCYGSIGQDVGNYTAGCIATQKLLAPMDVRRKSEPGYRAGFNSYTPPGPNVAPASPVVASPNSTASSRPSVTPSGAPQAASPVPLTTEVPYASYDREWSVKLQTELGQPTCALINDLGLMQGHPPYLGFHSTRSHTTVTLTGSYKRLSEGPVNVTLTVDAVPGGWTLPMLAQLNDMVGQLPMNDAVQDMFQQLTHAQTLGVSFAGQSFSLSLVGFEDAYLDYLSCLKNLPR